MNTSQRHTKQSQFKSSVFSRPLRLFAWLSLALAAALLLNQDSVREAAVGFYNGAFGGRNHFNLFSTLSRASIIIGMAMGVLISFRAGLINLGGEGQLVLGGITAAVVGIYVDAPPVLLMVLALSCAMLSGGLWAVLAGWLDRAAGVPLLVASLLMNYPATLFASWLVSHPLRDVKTGIAQSHKIDSAARLPRFEGTILDYGVYFILAVVVLVIALERYSVFGYRVRMHGYSQPFAKAAGFPMRSIFYRTLFCSGAIAGLVGFIIVFGFSQRYIDGMLTQPIYAWTGIVAVLLAGINPWLVPLSGGFFAVLTTGAAGMERVADLPREAAQIFQGLLILYLAGVGHSLVSRIHSRE